MADGGAGANPYVGLRPFERSDARLFFGREGETRELLSLVIASRVVLVYAASGAGKTSLLNAGLVPLLEREEGFEVLPAARLAGGLDERTLAAADNVYTHSLLSGWVADATALNRNGREPSLTDFLAARPHPRDADDLPAPRAVLFDQFEELFTLYPRYWKHQRPFVEQIGDALERDRLLRVVLAIREDHVAELDPFAELLPGALGIRYRLERLGREQALEAVSRPAERVHRSYAAGVAERLVDDLMTLRVDTGRAVPIVVQGPFVEPVQLQVTCHRLWSEMPADVGEVTDTHVRTYGDVDQVLAWFYGSAIRRAATAGQVGEGRLRRWIEQAFITSVGTRGTVYRSAEATAAIPNASIDALENEHLLRAEWRAGARWYELSHDRLIEPIRTSNRRFLAEVRRRRRRRGAIAGAAAALLLSLATGAALDRDGDGAGRSAGQTSKEATLKVRGVEYNLSFARYLVSRGVRVRNPSETELQARGNLLLVDVTTQGFQGVELLLRAMTHEAPGRRPASGPARRSSRRAVITPARRLETTESALWMPLPTEPGSYRYEVTLSDGTRQVARTRSERFVVTPGGRASRKDVRKPVPRPRVNLTIHVSGDGIVSVSPFDFRCPPTCAAELPYGQIVVLDATPTAGSRFMGWAGACAGRSTCAMKPASNVDVAALFTPVPP